MESVALAAESARVRADSQGRDKRLAALETSDAQVHAARLGSAQLGAEHEVLSLSLIEFGFGLELSVGFGIE